MTDENEFEGSFWLQVTKREKYQCWPWNGEKTSKGYGLLRRKGEKTTVAHRVAYSLIFGEIPEGKILHHVCRNPVCVNPYHLMVVTHRENILEGIGLTAINAKKTHCPNGHPYENNVYHYKGNPNWRTCIKCLRARTQRYRMNSRHGLNTKCMP